MTKGSDNVFPRVIYGMQTSDQAAPSDSSWRVYSKPGGIYARSSNAVVGPFASSVASFTPTIASFKRTTGSYTTTSATFVDVDGTNFNLTITTGAHRVLIGFAGSISLDTNLQQVDMDVTVDGTRQGGTGGLIRKRNESGAGGNSIANNASFQFLTDALSAGSHTFKLQWKVSTGTATMFGDSTTVECQFFVIEQGA